MEEKTKEFIKKHKVAIIIIVIFQLMSFLYNLDNTGVVLLTGNIGYFIGTLFSFVVMFFILFGVYYFIRWVMIKIKEKVKVV